MAPIQALILSITFIEPPWLRFERRD